MRAAAVLTLLALPCAALDADGYFDLGLDYLRTGFFSRARASFGESLIRAPGAPVTLAFIGVAVCGEGREASLCARLFRMSTARLPKSKGLLLDLRKQLPSERTLTLLHADYTRRLARAKGRERIDTLTVLAFFEVQDGDPANSRAVAKLLEADANDAFALSLKRLGSKKTKRTADG